MRVLAPPPPEWAEATLHGKCNVLLVLAMTHGANNHMITDRSNLAEFSKGC